MRFVCCSALWLSFFQALMLFSNFSEPRSLTDPSLLLPDTNLSALNKTTHHIAEMLAYTGASETSHLLYLLWIVLACNQRGFFDKVLEMYLCNERVKRLQVYYTTYTPPRKKMCIWRMNMVLRWVNEKSCYRKFTPKYTSISFCAFKLLWFPFSGLLTSYIHFCIHIKLLQLFRGNIQHHVPDASSSFPRLSCILSRVQTLLQSLC